MNIWNPLNVEETAVLASFIREYTNKVYIPSSSDSKG
jgi:hypothetical protein